MITWVEPWSDDAGAARARVAFTAAYGYPPTGVWSAPGRVNIIGEHVDYNGGVVLPIALPHRTFVAFAAREDDIIRLSSAKEDEPWQGALADVVPGTVDSWAAYVVGVGWALHHSGALVPGFDAAVESCVPYGAGLSSSAALECATAIALADIPGWDGPAASTVAGRTALADACIRAENEIAGANTGGMDQNASLHCRAQHALHFDTLSGEISHVPFDLTGHGLELLVIDTKAPHTLVDGQYASRRATCEAAAATLGVETLREVTDLTDALSRLGDDVSRKRVRHVITEIARVDDFVTSFTDDDMLLAGQLMTSSHESLRDDYDVSCAELDLAVETALSSGALGARMTGGGFGGSVIALVPAGEVSRVAEQVAKVFSLAGFTAPAFLIAHPSNAASRAS